MDYPPQWHRGNKQSCLSSKHQIPFFFFFNILTKLFLTAEIQAGDTDNIRQRPVRCDVPGIVGKGFAK